MAAGPETYIAQTLLHGTAIAIGGHAALIRGPSGSGKSDLALRCLALPAGTLVPAPPILISDDQVFAQRDRSIIRLTPPPAIAGKIEVRAIGIVEVEFAPSAALAVIVDLVNGTVERLPDPVAREAVLGVEVPKIRLPAFEASTPIKVALAIAVFAR